LRGIAAFLPWSVAKPYIEGGPISGVQVILVRRLWPEWPPRSFVRYSCQCLLALLPGLCGTSRLQKSTDRPVRSRPTPVDCASRTVPPFAEHVRADHSRVQVHVSKVLLRWWWRGAPGLFTTASHVWSGALSNRSATDASLKRVLHMAVLPTRCREVIHEIGRLQGLAGACFDCRAADTPVPAAFTSPRKGRSAPVISHPWGQGACGQSLARAANSLNSARRELARLALAPHQLPVLLTIIDECPRKCLAIPVQRRTTSQRSTRTATLYPGNATPDPRPPSACASGNVAALGGR
jgi:hypothetical protein